MNPLDEKLREIARKFNLGAMVPEGDGWSWDFEVSSEGLNALRAAAKAALEMALAEVNEVRAKRGNGVYGRDADGWWNVADEMQARLRSLAEGK